MTLNYELNFSSSFFLFFFFFCLDCKKLPTTCSCLTRILSLTSRPIVLSSPTKDFLPFLDLSLSPSLCHTRIHTHHHQSFAPEPRTQKETETTTVKRHRMAVNSLTSPMIFNSTLSQSNQKGHGHPMRSRVLDPQVMSPPPLALFFNFIIPNKHSFQTPLLILVNIYTWRESKAHIYE